VVAGRSPIRANSSRVYSEWILLIMSAIEILRELPPSTPPSILPAAYRTVRGTVLVAVVLPDVPVTVMV